VLRFLGISRFPKTTTRKSAPPPNFINIAGRTRPTVRRDGRSRIHHVSAAALPLAQKEIHAASPFCGYEEER
jgi:hypothetical protein